MNFVSLRPDYLKGWLERLAQMGYDTLLWELEDKVQWETCPECVWPEALSKEDFREILDYGRSLGFSHIPLLQTIGHAEYVLKHEPYHKFREDPDMHDCYCCCNSELRQFLRQWINEYLELFGTISAFHLGGDEAYRFATCPKCRARADAVGRNALYSEHITELAADLIARGIVPGIWGDMILAHPDEIDSVPKNFTIWDWNYKDGLGDEEDSQVRERGVTTADKVDDATPAVMNKQKRLPPFNTTHFLHSRGLKVILCGSSRSAGDSFFIGRHAVHGPNVVGAAQTARKLNLAGMCVTSWGVRVHPWETQMVWLQMAALAFRQPELSYSDLEERIFPELLGLSGQKGSWLLGKLGHPLPFARRHENGIQFNLLKDPVPAPPGYIRSVLDRWQAMDGEIERQGAERADSAADLAQAAATLCEQVGRGDGDPVFLESLTRALYFQIWAARFALDILSHAEKGDHLPNGANPRLENVMRTRAAMEGWARESMTPRHASLIAGLLFDRVEGFFKGE